MLSRTEAATKEDYEKAKARGIASGCEGAFLGQFIETELRLMEKWARKRKASTVREKRLVLNSWRYAEDSER